MTKSLPVWNVYQYDVNSQTFKLYNVYSHRGFLKDLAEMKDIEDIDEYAEKLRRSIMYHFWGRCEYEILIAEWPYDEEKGPRCDKVDISDMVKMNWPIFVSYTYNVKNEFVKE